MFCERCRWHAVRAVVGAYALSACLPWRLAVVRLQVADPEAAGDLRVRVVRCSAWSSSACNGRPANLLKLRGLIPRFRTENHGVAGSIPALGTIIS
jgi:hypothetical protein